MKWLLLLLLVFLLFPFVSALPGLGVSEQSFFLNQTVGSSESYPLVFVNVGSEVLYNLSFGASEGFVFPELASLGVNESFSTSFVFTAPVGVSGVVSSVLSFDYFQSLNSSVSSAFSSLTTDSFVIDDSELVLGSSIEFSNDDSVDLVVRCIPLNLTQLVSPGESFSYVLPVVGEFLFFEENFGSSLTVSVLPVEGDVLVHDSQYDVPFLFDVASLPQLTVLDVEFMIKGFEVSYDGSAQGVVRVINTGIFDAVNVGVVGDWISSELFSVAVNETKLVLFKISPEGIDKTSETNKTYDVIVSVNGVSDVLKVKVLYKDFDSLVTDDGDVIKVTYLSVNETLSYCRAKPDDSQCNKLVRVVNRTVVRSVVENVSLPADFVVSLKQGLDVSSANSERNTNSLREARGELAEVKSLVSSLEGSVDSYMRSQDVLKTKLEADGRSSRNRSVAFWIVFSLLSLVGITWYLIRRTNEQKNYYGVIDD